MPPAIGDCPQMAASKLMKTRFVRLTGIDQQAVKNGRQLVPGLTAHIRPPCELQSMFWRVGPYKGWT